MAITALSSELDIPRLIMVECSRRPMIGRGVEHLMNSCGSRSVSQIAMHEDTDLACKWSKNLTLENSVQGRIATYEKNDEEVVEL